MGRDEHANILTTASSTGTGTLAKLSPLALACARATRARPRAWSLLRRAFVPPVELMFMATGIVIAFERIWIGFASTLETSKHSDSNVLKAIVFTRGEGREEATQRGGAGNGRNQEVGLQSWRVGSGLAPFLYAKCNIFQIIGIELAHGALPRKASLPL